MPKGKMIRGEGREEALFPSRPRDPVVDRTVSLINEGQYDAALAAADVGRDDWRYQEFQLVASGKAPSFENLSPYLRSVVIKCDYYRRLMYESPARELAEWVLVIAFLTSRSEPPYVRRFLEDIRAKRTKGQEVLAGADWDTGAADIHLDFEGDRFLSWLCWAASSAPPPLAALAAKTIVAAPEKGVRARDVEGWWHNVDEGLETLADTALFQVAAWPRQLQQLKAEELKEIIAEWDLGSKSGTKAKLADRIVDALGNAELSRIAAGYALSTLLETTMDQSQVDYAHSLLEALRTECTLLLDTTDAWAKVGAEVARSREETYAEVKLVVEPGPDVSCPYCPQQKTEVATNTPLPPYHPGCRCSVSREYEGPATVGEVTFNVRIDSDGDDSSSQPQARHASGQQSSGCCSLVATALLSFITIGVICAAIWVTAP